MPRFRTFLCVALLSFAACTKVDLEDPEPAGVQISLSGSPIDADDGAITVTAQLLDDKGVPILEAPLLFHLTAPAGGTAPADQTILTDDTFGFAEAIFTNVDRAGLWTVAVSLGSVTNNASFTVEPGDPASLSFALAATSIAAGDGTAWTANVSDVSGNAISDAAISVLPSNGDVAFVYPVPGEITLTQAATGVSVRAEVAGFPALTQFDTLDVTPGDATQVTTALSTAAVGQLETLTITCKELDAYGNERTQANFQTSDVTISPAAGTLVETTPNTFQASGWTSVGLRTATCDLGAFDDDKSFNVVFQTATNTVLATKSASSVSPGSSLTVNCKEFDTFGNLVPTAMADWTVELTTDPDGSVTINSADGNAADGIDWTIGATGTLNTQGAYIVRCTSDTSSQQDSDDFVVVDLTPPGITSVVVSAATGVNGVQTDRHYAPGTSITFQVNATDNVGVRTVEVSLVSGQGAANEVDVFSTSADTTNVTTTVAGSISGVASTFGQLVYRITVTDRAGNTTSQNQAAFIVDPAVALDADGTLKIRTYYESLAADPRAVGVATHGTGFLVQLADDATNDIEQIIRLSGVTVGSASTFANAGFPAADASGGITVTASPFGGRTVFQALVPSLIGSVNGTGGHVAFSSNLAVQPLDVAFGNLGVLGDRLHYIDVGTTPNEIHAVDSAGVASVYFTDGADPLANVFRVTKDPASARLLLPDTSGVIHEIVDDTAGAGLRNALALTPANLPANSATDIVVANGKILVSGGTTGAVYRVNGLTVMNPITSDFDLPIGLAARGTEAFVLDDIGTGWRLYRVETP